MSKPNLQDILKAKTSMFDARDADGKVPTKMLGIRIPEDDHKTLKVLAAQQGTTLTAVVEEAVRDYINKHT